MAATLGELKAALVNADKAGDIDAARRLAAAVTHMQTNGLELYEPPARPMGFIDAAVEAVSGEKRKTKETEELPDWAGMPELNSLSIASAKTGLGTLLAPPKEIAAIIKSNYPDAQVRQDEKSNWVIKSSIDGKEYAIKPGFQVSDIPRALGALAAFTPAGRATTVVGMGAAAGATQAAIEGSQAATGGEFNPGEVVTATAIGGAIPAVVKGVQALKEPAKDALGRLMGAKPGAMPEVSSAAPSGTPAMPAAVVPPVKPPIAPVEPLVSSELAQAAKTAGAGGKRATQVLAEQAAPDAKVVEAAKRLGIEDYLQPDHVTTNQAYRELVQAVKSVPGSEARAAEVAGLNKIGQRADELITEIGGTGDVSQLSAKIKAQLQSTQSELEGQANKLYAELRQKIPAKSGAPAPNVLAFIGQRADELGGVKNLTSMEKTVLAKLSPKEADGVMKQPTYALLDDVRRDLTAAKYKRQGAFKDADTGLIKKLEMELKKDQRAAIEPFGVTETFDAAQAAVRVRKGIEDDLTSLFGKTLDKSIVGDLSAAVKSVAAGDTAKLVRLLKVTPENMRQELVATGLQTAFGKQVQNGALNFNTYARWYGGLLENKQAYAAVMSNLPGSARKQLSDLYRVAKGVNLATRERITTGRIQAVREELQGADSLIGSLYDLAKRASGGAAAEAVTTSVGLPGAGIAAGIASALTRGAKPNVMKVVDSLIASPEFEQAVKQAATGEGQKAAARLAYSKPFNKFMRAIGNPQELSNRERWILQTLEAQNQRQESK